MTYKYSELQVSFTTQKLSCKANYKTPIFFIVIGGKQQLHSRLEIAHWNMAIIVRSMKRYVVHTLS
jgi:hypothetical protein